MCQCGCRGWCTYFVLLLVVAWDLAACSKGRFNTLNHLDEPLQGTCQKFQGMEMGFLLCILDLMADWPAWCSWAGLRQWNHKVSPCPCCNISLNSMSSSDSVNGISVCAGPWSEYGSQEYEAELGQHMFDT